MRIYFHDDILRILPWRTGGEFFYTSGVGTAVLAQLTSADVRFFSTSSRYLIVSELNSKKAWSQQQHFLWPGGKKKNPPKDALRFNNFLAHAVNGFALRTQTKIGTKKKKPY